MPTKCGSLFAFLFSLVMSPTTAMVFSGIPTGSIVIVPTGGRVRRTTTSTRRTGPKRRSSTTGSKAAMNSATRAELNMMLAAMRAGLLSAPSRTTARKKVKRAPKLSKWY
jgi:hypothetical protein